MTKRPLPPDGVDRDRWRLWRFVPRPGKFRFAVARSAVAAEAAIRKELGEDRTAYPVDDVEAIPMMKAGELDYRGAYVVAAAYAPKGRKTAVVIPEAEHGDRPRIPFKPDRNTPETF